MMNPIFIEENGIYCIDCRKAVWATNNMNAAYHNAGLNLSDVDFVIENEDKLLLMEYKNANVPNASQPQSFHPEDEDKILKVSRKYYDSLHYLTLLGKNKPKRFVYVVESVHGDAVLRRRIRALLKRKLPFSLQEHLSSGAVLIEDVDVLSIDEWNHDPVYGKYPITPVSTA